MYNCLFFFFFFFFWGGGGVFTSVNFFVIFGGTMPS